MRPQAGKIDYITRCRLPCCLLGSRAPMWWVPRMAFWAATALLYFSWWLSHPTWRVDVDGQAYRLCHPMNCSWQVSVQSLLTGAVPSRRSAWGGVALVRLSGGCKTPESRCLMWCWPPGSLMDHNSYGKACLYQVILMRILVEELLC
jgi:hypothetical protein